MILLSHIFYTILKMSLTASIAAIVVILLRLPLKRSPKIFSYILWFAVLFRLICPFSFSSALSVFDIIPEHIQNPYHIVNDMVSVQEPIEYTKLLNNQSILTTKKNDSLKSTYTLNNVITDSTTTKTSYIMLILSFIWLAGFLFLLLYSLRSYANVQRRISTATLIKNNIYETDQINTAFVSGLIKPKIYLPLGVAENDLDYILAHEYTHIRRRDYLIKPLAYLIVILHWFNPLMWLSFGLMSRDMEMSCDESVIKKLGINKKVGYSNSLLSFTEQENSFVAICPLSFGESNVSARIKNVIKYKKPSFWAIVVAIIIVLTALTLLISNPKDRDSLKSAKENTNNMQGKKATNTEISSIDNKVFSNKSTPNIEIINQADTKENTSSQIDVSITPDTDTASNENELKQVAASLPNQHVAADTFPSNQTEAAELVEKNIKIILSSPKESSNPGDYIKKHWKPYDIILKYGNEHVLSYMLSQFKNKNAKGLRGFILMNLCKELLGPQNNVIDETLSPEDWYQALSIRQEVILPDFAYDKNDPTQALVYATELEMLSINRKNSSNFNGFIIPAHKIFATYEKKNILKVFIVNYSSIYRLYDNVLYQVSGRNTPVAITYKKDEKGNYTLVEYKEAMDGSEFAPSIRRFCTMPVTGTKIPGLADEIIKYYSDYHSLEDENLKKHLKNNNLNDIYLYSYDGKLTPIKY